MKLPNILKGVLKVKLLVGPAYSMTVLKRIMQTASLVIPSPNTKLNNFGYSSYFITAIAATTSVQHSKEHINKISMTERCRSSYISVSGLYFQSTPICTTTYVSIENTVN